MIAALLTQLSSLRSKRDRDSQRVKSKLLRRRFGFKRVTERQITMLHDLLLFEVAHQESNKLRRLAEARLVELYGVVVDKVRDDQDFLRDSGLAGSYRVDSFSRSLLDIMSARFGKSLDLNWDDNGSCGPAFDDLLRECLMNTESDAVLNEHVTTEQLLSILLRNARKRSLTWLLEQIDSLSGCARVKDRIFNSLDIWIRWHTTKRTWSRTFLRFPKAALPQKDGLFNVRISPRTSARLLDVCRGALASRGKETDTVVYTSPARVALYSCGHGVQVALFELKPDRRLAIESYIGYVAARHGVPIAYGGAWILGYRAEIGINIFEEFRGGDSRQLFSSILEVYQKRYAVKTFLVHPTQFGDDNDEALESGAFWFYYRLGFRPDDAALSKFAAREADKRRLNRRYKSPRRANKRLARKQLILERGTAEQKCDKALVTQELGYRLLRKIGDRFGGDRQKAQAYSGKLWSALGGKRSESPEIALLLCLLPNINKWSRPEKLALKNVLTLKGGHNERSFVRAFQKHARLRAELRDILSKAESSPAVILK